MKFLSPARGLLILCHAWLALTLPPVIYGPLERTYPAGQSFTLVCTGDKPLEWSWPESDRTTFEEKPVKTDTGYKSTLEVSDTDYFATGEYECYDSDTATKIYVYVPETEGY